MRAWESEPPCPGVIVCGHGRVNLLVLELLCAGMGE